MKTKKYDQAALLLKNIVDNYSYGIWADDALFNLAVLEEEQLQNKINAQQYFEQLIEKFPGSLYTIEARKRFRNLRGDNL